MNMLEEGERSLSLFPKSAFNNKNSTQQHYCNFSREDPSIGQQVNSWLNQDPTSRKKPKLLHSSVEPKGNIANFKHPSQI